MLASETKIRESGKVLLPITSKTANSATVGGCKQRRNAKLMSKESDLLTKTIPVQIATSNPEEKENHHDDSRPSVPLPPC